MAAYQPDVAANGYPSDEQFRQFIGKRHSRGRIWLLLFMAATLVGIVALMALLITVANDAFGYVAIQSKVSGSTLVSNHYKQKMLSMPSTIASEDDQELADGIAPREMAIGFFGSGVYQQNSDGLGLLAVDGVLPDEETVAEGRYPLARPLFIYSGHEIMQQRPEVAAFTGYYLDHLDEAVGPAGYFPASSEAIEKAREAWARSSAMASPASPSTLGGSVRIAGSSTVAPITLAIAESFRRDGFAGEIIVVGGGTDAGIRALCLDRVADVADASRSLTEVETAACAGNDRVPVEMQVGADGLAVVTSQKNEWLSGLSSEQLKTAFTQAIQWNEVDPSFPAKRIFRFIPGQDSGTLDFFVASVWGSLEQQSVGSLAEILAANISAGRLRALEAAKPFAQRSQQEVLDLVEAEVVQPKIVKSWSLLESVLHRGEIAAEVAQMPNTRLEFKSWINASFLTSTQSADPAKAGIRTAILGSLWITLLAMLVAVPVGVGAAIYLEEFAGRGRIDQLIETNINNLAGVPSIIYGMLGLAVFVRTLSILTSGGLFGFGDATTSNGRTILSGALTLALLVLPLLIINAREAIRAVPRSIREASMGLGATKWQTARYHVLPSALPGILTGTILAMGRVLGETAPLIVVGVSTYIVVDPKTPFDKFTTLPAQIYQWTSRPQAEFQHLAAAAILVLLVLLLALNAAAIVMRNKFSVRY
jgi:phosphate transport system permease protein